MKYTRCLRESWIGRLLVLSGLTAFLATGSHALAVGAATPFTTLEAEDGTAGSGAAVVSWTVPATPPTISSPEIEASGRSYVKLSATGQTVSWTNPVANANGLNIRFMIPDGATGGGTTATLDLYVNGSFVQAITMSSAQAWVYETNLASNGLNDAPGTGLSPHFFWDETHVMLATPIPSGATIALKKDSTNTAAYYGVDCIDLEVTGAAKAQPANSLSITASPYNAVSGGTADCTTAIQNCINAAQTAGKSVWIPAGKYLITNALSATNVTIAGAGMWYSEIYKQPSGTNRTKIAMSGGTIQDLYIDTNSKNRGFGADGDYGIVSGVSDGLTVQRVWLQHTNAAVWMAGTNSSVLNCRIASTWADGINLNNGNDIVGSNLTAKNNFIRGTGDDGIAVYSNNPNGTGTTVDTADVEHNTIVAPWWADGMRIAGGKNITMSANLVTDAVTNKGIVIGIYGTAGFPLISATVNNNTVLRSGGGAFPYAVSCGGSSTQPVTANISGNIIEDSPWVGFALTNGAVNIEFGPSNTINTVGTIAIEVLSGSTGSATLQSDLIANLLPGQTPFVNNSPTTFPVTRVGGTGF